MSFTAKMDSLSKPTSGNDDINFSAFKNKTVDRFAPLIFKSIFIFVATLIIALIFMVLWMWAGDSTGVDPVLAKKSGSAIAGMIGLAGSAWAVARILLVTQKRRDVIFKKFASDNGFVFTTTPNDYDRIALLDYGQDYSVLSEACVSGKVNSWQFKLSLITVTSKIYYSALPKYLGLLRLQLPTPNAPSHELYKYPQTPPDIKIPEGLGKISTEIIGNHIYFVKEDGLDMAPEGMRRFFGLVDSIASSPAQT